MAVALLVSAIRGLALAFGIKSTIDVAKLGIQGAASFIGITTFIGFLYEETIQASGFPIFELVKAKQFDAARKQLEVMKRSIDDLDAFINGVGDFNELTDDAFKAYVRAARSQYDGYVNLIANKEAETGMGTIQRGVYDFR